MADGINNEDNNNNDHVEEEIEEYGAPPTFTHPDSLSRLIPKPSGNMVRLPCAARGKVINKMCPNRIDTEINSRIHFLFFFF